MSEVHFGPFRLAPSERKLERDGQLVTVGGRALDLLIALATRPGEILTRHELMEQVWPGFTVEEANLRVHISHLRKALGDSAVGETYIANVPGRGYCFVAPVTDSPAAPPQAPYASPQSSRLRLPPRLSRMVGRDEVVANLVALQSRERLTSIIGPGGMGKTTVAVAVAHELAEAFDGEVDFVDLSTLTDPGLAVGFIATSIGARLTEPDPFEGLLAFAGQRRMLIVLDNCEHLADAIAMTVERFLQKAPGVHLILTSREPLRAEGEFLHVLEPLAFPPDDTVEVSELLRYPAAQLFLERAETSGYREPLTHETGQLVAQMCYRLDGIALAIELVASRLGTHGLRGTSELLENRFKLLWRGRRSALPRHQTLHAMLDWSFNLLSPRDRMTLAYLGAFAGPFDLAAIDAVAGRPDDDPGAVADSIDNLVEKSLVWAHASPVGGLYRLSHVTREFALAELAKCDDRRDVALRHARYVLQRLREHWSPAPASLHPPEAALASMLAPDLRAALAWSFSQDGDEDVAIDLVAAAAPLWLRTGPLSECLRWSERALALLPVEDRGGLKELALQEALAAAGMFTRGNDETVRVAIDRGLELARALDPGLREIRLLSGQHIYLTRIGEFDAAIGVGRRALEVGNSLGLVKARIMGEWMLATAYHLVGRQAEALEHCNRGFSMDAAGAMDLDFFAFDHRVRTLIVVTRALWLQGHWDQGLETGRNAIAEAEQRGAPASICIALIYTITALLWNGSFDEAAIDIDRLEKLSRRNALAPYHACSLALRGQLLSALDRHEEAITLLQTALGRLQEENHLIMNSGAWRRLAWSLGEVGRFDQAFAVADSAIERAERFGGRADVSELLRIRGELHRCVGDEAAAEADFSTAIQIAERQTAWSWRLRSGLALARLWAAQGRMEAAEREVAACLQVLDRCGPGELGVTLREQLLAVRGGEVER